MKQPNKTKLPFYLLRLMVLALFLSFGSSSYAQIAVTITGNTNTTPNLAASYTSFANFVTALNSVTAVSGSVTATLANSSSETAPVKGFVIRTSNANLFTTTNTLTIVKATGGTATVINAGTGTSNGPTATPDGMLYLDGMDGVTIDGLTFTDGNTASATVAMEFGIAFFKRAAGDGCNNNRVQNCTFNMQRINNAAGAGPMADGACAIQVLNSTSAAATTALTPTNGGTLATNGTNSNNVFYSNTINNGNTGIYLSGFAATVGVGPTPTATTFLGDINNIIGASTLGNTILNFGGGASTNPAAGIRANNQWSLNVNYNTVNNNNGSGVNHATTLRGIYLQAGTSANVTCTFNTVSIKGGATTSTVTAIDNGIGGTAASNAININNNTISNCSYSTSTSGAFTCISNTASAATLNINNNTIQTNSLTGAATSAIFTGIVNTGSTGLTVNIGSNTISGITLGGTGTQVMISVGSPGGTASVTSNTIQTITNSALSGITRGIIASTPVGLYSVTGNTIEGISYTAATSTGSIDGIYNLASATLQNWNNNIIRNLSTPTTGAIRGIMNNTVTGTFNFNNNQIYNFSTTSGGAGGASFAGIQSVNGAATIQGNIIYSLNSTGSTGGSGGTIYGISITGGTTQNIIGNAIYDLSTTSTNPTVAGINLAGGTTNNLSNNLIGDLRATASTATVGLAGILVSSGTTNNIFHNTINLNSTGGATFGSSGIYFSSSTPVNNFRNNIIVNTSTPGSTSGITAAIRYTTAPTSTNFPAANNNNLYFAGTPGTNRVIYADNTTPANNQQTLAAYKTYIATTLPVAGREGSSVSQNLTFVSTTGSNPITNFLQYPLAVYIAAEQGGGTGTGITTDFTGTVVRCPNGACPGGASISTPDIGAWELNNTTCNTLSASVTPNTAFAYCSPGGAPVSMVGSASGGSTPYTTVWSPSTDLYTNSGGTIPYSGGAQLNTWATPSAARTYTFTVTDNLGCVRSASRSFTTKVGINLTLNPSTPGITICPGDQLLTATATPGTNYFDLGSYSFSSGTGASLETFTSQTVVTTVTTGTLDDGMNDVTPSPAFVFPYNNANFSAFSAGTNGMLRLGIGTSFIPSSLTSTLANAIHFFGRDANMNDANGGNLTHGPAVGGKYVFQFTKNSGGASGAASSTNFVSGQIVLWGSASATPGRIDIIYGTSALTPASNGSIGISSASGLFWNAVTGNNTVLTTSATYPASGTIYTFTPPAFTPTYAWTETVGNPLTGLFGGFTTSSVANPLVSGLDLGSFSYPLTVNNAGNGCSASGLASIIVSSTSFVVGTPTVSIATTCAGNATVLTGTNQFSGGCPPYTYKWKANGVDIPDYVSASGASGTSTITVSSTSGLLVGMVLTVSGGTGAFAANTKVASIISATQFTTDIPATIALSGAAVVTGKANGTLAASNAVNTLTVSPTSTTVYTLEVTDAGLANGSGNVTVTVNPLPVVTITPTPSANYCAGGTRVTLAGTGTGNYEWDANANSTYTNMFTALSGGSAYAGFVSSGQLTSVFVEPTVNRTYRLRVTDGNGCVGTATQAVIFNTPPVISSTTATPSNICVGATSNLAVNLSVPSNATQYSFSTSTGASLDPMTGATSAGVTTDDTPSSLLTFPSGFTFNYEGTNFTQFTVSPDGWLKLGSPVGVSSFTNAIASATNPSKLMIYWDDLTAGGTGGNVSYVLTGSAPNRIFKVQWFVAVPRNGSSTTAANSTFQMWLYETSNVIEYRYGTMGTNLTSTSVGIGGATTSNYLSVNLTSNTASSTTGTANDAQIATPVSGRMFSFTPPAPPAYTYTWSPAPFIASGASTASATTSALAGTQAFSVVVSDGICSATGNATVNINPLAVNPTATAAPVVTNAPDYTFAPGTGASLDPMTSPTTLVASSVDDTPGAGVAIGFNFVFSGTTYTHISASPDGWVALGTNTTAATSNFTNSVVSTTTVPRFYPYWDDLATGTTGNVTSVVTGSSPNRILKVQWFVTIPRNTTGAANSTFQAWFYETTNVIEYRYGTMGSAAMSASAGLTQSATLFQSITTSTNTVSTSVANNAIADQPVSGTKYTFTPPVIANCSGNLWNLSAGVTGGIGPYTYTWSVLSGASGLSATNIANPTVSNVPTNTYYLTVTDGCSPTGSASGNVTRTVFTAPSLSVTSPTTVFCSGTSGVPLTATSSASPITWSPSATLSAASTASGIPTLATPASPTTYTATTAYDVNGCRTSATIGPITTAISPSLASLTANPPSVCPGGNTTLTATPAPGVTYCNPSSGTVNSANILTVAINTLSYTGPSGSLYNNNPAIGNNTTSLTAGSSFNITVTTQASAIVSVWIDFNQNGTFEASEWFQPMTTGTTGTVSVPVPTGALNGPTRMRVRSRSSGSANGAANFCEAATFFSGNSEDFTVTITGGVVTTFNYTWSETPNSTITPANVNSLVASGLPSTSTYTVVVSDGTCSATQNVVVPVAPLSATPTATVVLGASNYEFTPSNGTFTSIVGAPGAVSTPAVNADTYISPAIPLGFSFTFAGVAYSNVYVSSNGFLSFNSGAGANNTNNIASSTAGNYPLLAPLWDDLDANGGVGAAATYLVTGAPGNKVFTFEWTGREWFWTSNQNNISFQIKLYEATGKIEFVYSPITNPMNSPSASIGIASAPGNFLSLDGTGTNPNVYSFVETNTINTNPAAGQIYAFTPPVASCPGVNALVTAGATAGGAPYTYSWTSVPPGFTSTASAINVKPDVTTTYNVVITDDCGATASGSATVNVSVNPMTVTPSSASVCGNNPVTINLSGAGSYSYFPNYGVTSSTATSITSVAPPGMIPLTVTGFNADVVANGIGNVSGSTTADVDGTGNAYFNDFTFQQGPSDPTQAFGAPTNNLVESFGIDGLRYVLASYTGNNSLRLAPSASGTLATPSNPTATNLYALVTCGNTTNRTFNATITFTDASTQVFTGLTVKNWLTGTVYSAAGFGYVNNTGVQQGTALTPRVFDVDLAISVPNQTKQIASVTFTYTGAVGIMHVMALTAKTLLPAPSITYTLFGTALGCEFSRQATINYQDAPPLTLTSSNVTICEGVPSSAILVNGTGATDYDSWVWSPSPGDVTGNQNTGFIFNPANSKTLTLNASQTTGLLCNASTTVNVTVNANPNSGIATVPANVCENGNVALTGSGFIPSNSGILLNETFEGGLGSNFAVSGAGITASATGVAATSSAGAAKLAYTNSLTLAGTNNSFVLQNNINLSGNASAQLTFNHICALEGATTVYDRGVVQYSIDGGANWLAFPASSYAGSGTLLPAAPADGIAFTTRSYADWITNITATTSVPTNSLYKSETINIPSAALTSSQFRIRFIITSDIIDLYDGWYIDNVKIVAVPPALTYAWSGAGGFSTASSATIGATLTGAQLTNSGFFTVTATNPSGCTASASSSLSVIALPTASLTGTAPHAVSCETGQVTVSGASATNSASVSWSIVPSVGSLYVGAGSIISGGASFAPTYQCAPGDAGQNVTLKMTVVGNAPCATQPSVLYVINVRPRPTLTISPNSLNICNDINGVFRTLSVTSPEANTNYIWSPINDLYTDPSFSTPYTGDSRTTVYAVPFVTTTFSVSATNTNTGCTTGATSVTLNVCSALTNSICQADAPTPAVPVTTTATFTTYSLLGATASPGVPCAPIARDVYYRVVVPSNGELHVFTAPGTNAVANLNVQSTVVSIHWAAGGTCTTSPVVACNSGGAAGNQSYTFFSGMTPGSIAYIRLGSTISGNSSTAQFVRMAVTSGLIWTGAASSSFNSPANWIGGDATALTIPSSTKSVIIRPVTSPAVPPAIVGAQVAKNITMQTNALMSISAGAILSIKGDVNLAGNSITGTGFLELNGTSAQTLNTTGRINYLTVNNSTGVSLGGSFRVGGLVLKQGPLTTNNKLTILSDAGLTGYIDNFTTGNTGTIVGNVNMERRVVGTAGNVQHYLSTPVAHNATVYANYNDDFSVAGTPGYVYSSDPTAPQPSSFPTTWWYNETLTYQYTPGWTNASQVVLAPGQGFAANISGTKVIDAVGTLTNGANTGTIAKSLTFTDDGFNLIGNPYPSSISFNQLVVENSSLIYPQLYIWNGAGSNYASYNGVAWTNNPAGSLSSDIMGHSQSWFVIAQGPGTLNFNNTQRTTSSPANFFAEQPGLIRLEVSTESGKDEVVVYNDNNSTENFDAFVDAKKFMGAMTPVSAFTLSKDNMPLAINAMDKFDAEQIIPVQVVTENAGMATIKLNLADLKGNYEEIYLEDATLNKYVDLKANESYTAQVSKGNSGSRFFLHFKDKKVADAVNNSLTIYANDSKVFVNIPTEGNTRIEVMNVLGQNLVTVDANSFKGLKEVSVPNAVTGSYLVKVTNAGKVYTQKVVLTAK